MAFMGSCLAGAMASSQAFFSLSVSISSVVGALRDEMASFLVLLRYCIVSSAMTGGIVGMPYSSARSEAWWILQIRLLRLRGRMRVQVENPLRRRRWWSGHCGCEMLLVQRGRQYGVASR
jgi:hypothetical protein